MSKDSGLVKLHKLFKTRYDNLKHVADLLAACPHVVPSGIGIAQYLEELKKGARQLSEYLEPEEDFEEYISQRGDLK